VASVISLHEVEVTYASGHRAVRRVSLRIERGSFTVLLGRSGAGKSTLLRCLNGLVRPSGGRVRVEGVGDLEQRGPLRAHRRRTGMVFQQHQLMGRLTAFLNVMIGRLPHHRTLRSLLPLPVVDRQLALACLDRVGLLPRALSRVDELSGGEQQRVGVARALAQQPSLILGDEPVASLDPATAVQILDLLGSVQPLIGKRGRSMKRPSFLLLTLSLAVAVLVPLRGQMSPAHAADPDPRKLRVALLPDESASTIIQNNQPLKVYLEKTLGREVELVVTTDYGSMIEAMRFGRLELGYFGPLSYLLASSRSKIEPFAALVTDGSPTYTSYLIANTGAGVSKAEDVKGKTVAFGDPASTSSHLVPRSLLKDKGLVAATDYKFQHLGTHDAVARAVQAGHVQVGGISRPIFRRLIEKKSIDPARVKPSPRARPSPITPGPCGRTWPPS
jgi:phosphonate transport system substrate-binding protein